MTVAGKPAPRHEYQPDRPWPGPPPSPGEEQLCTLTYLGVLFSGPVVPLYVYLTRRHASGRSGFVRWHAVQALNVALTFLLYMLSGGIVFGLLTLDKLSTALATVVPVVAVFWVIAATQLTRAAFAASRGEYRELPAWICSPLVRQAALK